MGLVSATAFAVIDQKKNTVTIINKSPEPVTVEDLSIRVFATDLENARNPDIESRIMPDNSVLPADANVTFRFEANRQRRLYSAIRTKKGLTLSRAIIPVWGNRVVISITPSDDIIQDRGSSALRQIIDANRKWIPLPAAWLD